jgi:hypothetical protein
MTVNDVVEFINTCSKEDLYTIRRVSQARITAGNQSKKSTTVVVRRSDFAKEMANTLWESVKINFPFLKEPDLDVWASDIDKLERIDKIDRELIRAVLLWSQQSTFWKNNIRSGASLRRNFVQVYGQAKSQIETQRAKGGKVYKV